MSFINKYNLTWHLLSFQDVRRGSWCSFEAFLTGTPATPQTSWGCRRRRRHAAGSTSSLCYKLQIKTLPRLSAAVKTSLSASYPHPPWLSFMVSHAHRDMCKALGHTGLGEASLLDRYLPQQSQMNVSQGRVCVCWGQTNTAFVCVHACTCVCVCVHVCIG